MWMHLHSRGNSWPRVCHFGDAHNVPCWAMTHDTHVSTKSGRLWKRVVEALLGMQHQLTCRPWPKRIWDKNAVMIQVTDYISGVLGLSSSSLDSAKKHSLNWCFKQCRFLGNYHQLSLSLWREPCHRLNFSTTNKHDFTELRLNGSANMPPINTKLQAIQVCYAFEKPDS